MNTKKSVKRIVIFAFSVVTFCNVNAQENPTNSSNTSTNRENVVSLSIAPASPWSFHRLLYDAKYQLNNNYSNSSSPVIVLSYEHYLKSKFSFGVSLLYNNNIDRWTETDSLGVSTKFGSNTNSLKIQTRFTYHFFDQTEHFDYYMGGGVGFNTTFGSNSQNGTKTSFVNWDPFSMRLYTGFTYSFNNGLGLNTEFGLGGPLLTVGVNYKF